MSKPVRRQRRKGARDTKKQVGGARLHKELFKVRCPLESDVLEGAALPDQVNSVALRMAAVGASLIDVCSKLVQLDRASTPTTMNQLKSQALICRNAPQNGIVSHGIKKRHVLQVSAR